MSQEGMVCFSRKRNRRRSLVRIAALLFVSRNRPHDVEVLSPRCHIRVDALGAW